MEQHNTTIFTTMSALAQEHHALNLAQGFPGFSCDEALLDKATEFMKLGYNQYAPMAGALPLREAIAKKIADLYQVSYSVHDEICVTAGATEAVYVAIQALVQAGDEVVILEPAFDIYAAAVKMAGAVPVFVKLSLPDFSIDWDALQAALSSKTKLLIINSPHNPTGSILKKSDLEHLNELVQHHAFYVLSDEVYEHLIFDGEIHHSAISFPALQAKSVVIFSLGKTYHVTGWRVGYCVAPKEIMSRIKAVHQYVTFSAATPFQLALSFFLEKPETYTGLSAYLEQKRDLFLNVMQGTGFEPIPSKGTYFQLMRYHNISKASDMDFAKELVLKNKVATIPISYFYHDKQDDHILRFCFAKADDELRQAAMYLKKKV